MAPAYVSKHTAIVARIALPPSVWLKQSANKLESPPCVAGEELGESGCRARQPLLLVLKFIQSQLVLSRFVSSFQIRVGGLAGKGNSGQELKREHCP